MLAQRFSVSTETIREWREPGAEDCQDHSSRPHKLPWKATEEERAIVCALRQATGFPLDDLTFIVTTPCRISTAMPSTASSRLRARGDYHQRSSASAEAGAVRDYDLGFVHRDIKHLPKLQTADGECRKRFLYVAIDRCSRLRAPGGQGQRDRPQARSLS